MRRISLLLALALVPVFGQQQKAETAPKPANAVRVFQLRHGNGDSIVQTLRNVDVRVTFDRRLNVLAVSAPPEAMAGIADVVQKLDQPAPPPKNVEITAYILVASNQAMPDTVPGELEPVIKQLRATFGLQGFRVADAPILRSRENEMTVIGGTLVFGPAENAAYRFEFRPSISGPSVIRLERMNLYSAQASDLRIAADVDISAGQKVVVGKAGYKGKGQEDRSIILVLSGRIID